jgi:hypothetical protein
MFSVTSKQRRKIVCLVEVESDESRDTDNVLYEVPSKKIKIKKAEMNGGASAIGLVL